MDKEAINRVFTRMIVEFIGWAIGFVSFAWVIIQILDYINVDLAILKRFLSIHLLLVICLIALIILIISIMFAYKRLCNLKPIQNINSNEVTLVDEIVSSIKGLHDKGSHKEVVRLCEVLSRPLWLSGKYLSRIELGKFLEDSAASLGLKPNQATALIDDMGWTSVVVGKKDEGIKNIQSGIRVASNCNDNYLIAKGYRHLGTISLRYEAKPNKAAQHFKCAQKHALLITENTLKKEMEAGINFNLAEVFLEISDFDRALKFVKQSQQTYKSSQDKTRLIKVIGLLAQINLKNGQLEESLANFREALNLASMEERKDEIGKSKLGLGSAFLHRGNKELALKNTIEARDIFNELGAQKELNDANQQLILIG
jgi:tetratricopeptide (TPR) repeat protein